MILSALQEIDTEFFENLHREINPDRLYQLLKPLADTVAPSQTVQFTRARVVEEMLEQAGLLKRDNVQFVRNFQNTGNAVLLLGRNEHAKDVWLLAHLDQISYLVERPKDGQYPLTPNCYHLMDPGRRSAVAVGYNLETCSYEIITHGEILTQKTEDMPLFLPANPVSLHQGMRVCYTSQLQWNRATGEIQGSLDDAAGAAALILAAQFLARYDMELMLGLTDEEEGKAGLGSQSIGRGGSRLLRYFDQPQLVIASDIHEAADMYGGTGPLGFNPGDGASFAEKAASAVGEITPPHLYELERQLAKELTEVGINLRENIGGYISRTEGINALRRTPNICLMGFLGVNRHFQRDVESCNINDLVNLAKSIVCASLLVKTRLWKDCGFAS